MVGGAVRDMLMGIEPKDIDYVVVGATPDYMENVLGMKRVGQDFPVFLDENGDEYALARRERSTGEGYVDFQFEVDGVSLAEDLLRRDLTINAIAKNKDIGNIFDPYGGRADIEDKIFRPVSDAFMEDPVRVLRVARLRARYGADWTLSDELRIMVKKMVKKGVLSNLQPDRVWKEMSRALMEPNPRLFFDTLYELDALHVVFPEIYKMLTSLEPIFYHPEKNTYEHTMLVLTQAANFGYDIETRFSCLMHDIGKTLTTFDKFPAHYGHDIKGVELVEQFGHKYKIPSKMIKIAKFATRYHMYGHKLGEMNPKTIVKMFDEINLSSQKIDFVVNLKNVFECDERGRLGYEHVIVDDKSIIIDWANSYIGVKFDDVFPNGETNVNKIKDGMFRKRCAAIKK